MTPSASLVAFRYGYGLPLAAGAPAHAADMLAALAGPDLMATRFPIVTQSWLSGRAQALTGAKKRMKFDPAAQAEFDAITAEVKAATDAALRATLARAIDTADGFRERLVAFWADHFTVAAFGQENGASSYTFVEDAIRPHLNGPFADLLIAATRHPAMLAFLDQTRSVGPTSASGLKKGLGLNENFARELLELHTLGISAAYSQTDVRQLAELLTGLAYDDRRGAYFDARRAEPGAETVLGKTYAGRGEAPVLQVLTDLAHHPETARHMARKLAVHFLSDTPDPAAVDAMAQAWIDSGGDLSKVYSALLSHPAAWAETLAKARQPFDFITAAFKALGLTGADVLAMPEKLFKACVIQALHDMGQRWKAPPGPDGWPEDIATWITPQGMTRRIDWAMRWPAQLTPKLPHPTSLAQRALGDRASPTLLWAAERAENLAEGVGIVLAAPEFNRR